MTAATIIVPLPGDAGEATVIVEQDGDRHEIIFDTALGDDLRDWQAMDVNDRRVRAIEARAAS